MGKVWGYDNLSDNCGCYQTEQSKCSDQKKTSMKCLPVYTIQRQILARQMLYLSQNPVFRCKATDVHFEEKVKELKRQSLLIKAPTCYGGLRCLRRKRSQSTRRQEKDFSTGSACTAHQFDFVSLSYKTLEFIRPKKSSSRENDIPSSGESTLDTRDLEVADAIEYSEGWQREHWMEIVHNDLKSADVNEIICNLRLATVNDAAITGHRPSCFTIYLEAARNGLKRHDWPMVCVCIEGMLQEYKGKLVQNNKFTIVWLLGFLVIINHYKYDTQLVRYFASQIKHIIKGHPAWVGVQMALWQIQKGLYNEGRAFMNNVYSYLPLHSYYRKCLVDEKESPKRDMVFYLSELINAIHLYWVWKSEFMLFAFSDELAYIYAMSIQRNGEAALSAFENVYEYFILLEVDVMSFLPLYVEILLEFRSLNYTRQVVQYAFEQNSGNMYVEKFHLDFMEKHYTGKWSTDSLNRFRESWSGKFEIDKHTPYELKTGRAKIFRLREAKKTDSEVAKLKLFPLPKFSWD